MAGSPELAWGVVFAVLVAATIADLRSRRVPAWLTGGAIAVGVLLAAWAGPPAQLCGEDGAELLAPQPDGLFLRKSASSGGHAAGLRATR